MGEHFNSWYTTICAIRLLHLLVSFLIISHAFIVHCLSTDRSEAGEVTHYQDWLAIPDYPGKDEDEENLKHCTVNNLVQVKAMLEGHE